MHPGAGVAAVVDGVIDQQRVAAQKDAAARGFDVGFGGDGVLLVTEIIADVGYELGEDDSLIGFGGCSPVRQKLVEAVEQDSAQRAVVLGEIVDGRRFVKVGWAVGWLWCAVEVRTAFDLEEELDFG